MDHRQDTQDRFTAADACTVADITHATLLNWVSRQPPAILLTAAEREVAGKGYPLTFSFNRIMQIAITAEMVRVGWRPRPAAMAAVAFTDVGESSGHREGEEAPTVRRPGELFATGTTLLIAYDPSAEAGRAAKCIKVDADTNWSALFGPIRRGGVPLNVATIVNVSHIWVRARMALGLHL